MLNDLTYWFIRRCNERSGKPSSSLCEDDQTIPSVLTNAHRQQFAEVYVPAHWQMVDLIKTQAHRHVERFSSLTRVTLMFIFLADAWIPFRTTARRSSVNRRTIARHSSRTRLGALKHAVISLFAVPPLHMSPQGSWNSTFALRTSLPRCSVGTWPLPSVMGAPRSVVFRRPLTRYCKRTRPPRVGRCDGRVGPYVGGRTDERGLTWINKCHGSRLSSRGRWCHCPHLQTLLLTSSCCVKCVFLCMCVV